MRVFALTSRLFSLSSFATVLVATFSLLLTAGCGHEVLPQVAKAVTLAAALAIPATPAARSAKRRLAPPATPANAVSSAGYAPPTLSEPVAPTYQQSAPVYSPVGTSQPLPYVQPAPVAFAPAPIAPAPAQIYTPPAPTVSSFASTAPAGAPGAGGQYHTLARGETIYALSRQYNVRPKAILEANHFSDPNHLSVGTKVYIPAN